MEVGNQAFRKGPLQRQMWNPLFQVAAPGILEPA